MKKKIVLEANDLSALLVLFNVILVIAGWAYAPYFGVINCVWGLMNAIKDSTRGHHRFNVYVINIALLILNVYFLR